MADRTSADYDAVSRPYADKFANELDHKPSDRRILDDFASGCEGSGVVVDVGCGPGQVAAYLTDRGVTTIGVDLSPGMIACAQERHPHLDFLVGNMRHLPFEDESLAGVTAFYSIIHIPRDDVPAVLAEWHRKLRRGAPLLLAFHQGDSVNHVNEFLGEPVCLDFVFFTTHEMETYLTTQGFDLLSTSERGPYPNVEAQTERVYVLARRPI